MEEELLQRVPEESPTTLGKSPEDRTIQELLEFGCCAVDKPSGPTSHQVSAYVQQILGIKKAGHSGTLDPKVTGVLPIGTERATRLLEFLLKAGKTYVGVMHLHDDVEEYEVRKKAESFIGKITQLPPKRSSVARRKRERTIYSFRFLEIRGRDILFEADVQAGTYIRKLCHDFGEALGCGAHMAELRRTRAAHFVEEDAVSLQTLADAYHVAKEGDETLFREIVKPAEYITKDFPKIIVHDSAVPSLASGATLKLPGIIKLSPNIQKKDAVQILTRNSELVGVGTSLMTSQDMLEDQGVAVKMEKVFFIP